jgi:hypothetical protein
MIKYLHEFPHYRHQEMRQNKEKIKIMREKCAKRQNMPSKLTTKYRYVE